jgi:serine/threonine-protein kinase
MDAVGQCFQSTAMYRFVRRLGSGGLADVLLYARRSAGSPEQEVALKVLRERNASNIDELLSDGEKLRQLKHPNIVATFGFERMDAERLALVLEYIPGCNLATIVRRIDVVHRPRVALHLARILIDALSAAHNKEIVHGDLTPRNILVSEGGQLKVVDFGLGRQSASKGSPDYIAPERWQGVPPSKSGDVYSLGIVVLEVLTGLKSTRSAWLTGSVLSSVAAEWRPFFLACLNERFVERPAMQALLELLPEIATTQGETQRVLAEYVNHSGIRKFETKIAEVLRTHTLFLRRGLTMSLFCVGQLVSLFVFCPLTTEIDTDVLSRFLPCTLTVTSNPWGEVFIDEVSVGFTPLLGVAVKPGFHRLVWKSARGEITSGTFTAFNNGSVRLVIKK